MLLRKTLFPLVAFEGTVEAFADALVSGSKSTSQFFITNRQLVLKDELWALYQRKGFKSGWRKRGAGCLSIQGYLTAHSLLKPAPPHCSWRKEAQQHNSWPHDFDTQMAMFYSPYSPTGLHSILLHFLKGMWEECPGSPIHWKPTNEKKNKWTAIEQDINV